MSGVSREKELERINATDARRVYEETGHDFINLYVTYRRFGRRHFAAVSTTCTCGQSRILWRDSHARRGALLEFLATLGGTTTGYGVSFEMRENDENFFTARMPDNFYPYESRYPGFLVAQGAVSAWLLPLIQPLRVRRNARKTPPDPWVYNLFHRVKDTVTVATDASAGSKGKASWAWVSSTRGHNMGQGSTGEISVVETEAIVQAINDHPNVPLHIISDSQVALQMLDDAIHDRQVTIRTHPRQRVYNQLKAALLWRKKDRPISWSWQRGHGEITTIPAALNDGADRLSRLSRRFASHVEADDLRAVALAIVDETFTTIDEIRHRQDAG